MVTYVIMYEILVLMYVWCNCIKSSNKNLVTDWFETNKPYMQCLCLSDFKINKTEKWVFRQELKVSGPLDKLM